MMLLLSSPLFATGGQEGPASDEKMTINWMAQFEDSWVYDHVEEMFNVDIVPNGIYVNDAERVSVMLAAGEFPDCGPLWENALEIYEDGVTRSLPKAMIRDYAPDIAKAYDQYSEGWIANTNPKNDDELLAINGVSATTDYNIFLPMMRADWVLNSGGELPGYEAKKLPLDRVGKVFFLDYDMTLEQYEGLLRAFKDGDLDGNGKDDTIPYGASNNLWRSFTLLAGAFGVPYNGNRYVDGQLYDYRTDPGMKELLVMLNGWYADGLIDGEFAGQDLRKGWDKIDAGIVGTVAEVVTNAGQVYAGDRPPNSFVKDEELGTPGAEVVVLPALIGPNGDQGARAYRDLNADGGYRWFVNRKVDDAKLAKILEIINYGRATEEGFIYFQYGKPDVHFDWEADAWNSKPVPRAAEDVPEGEKTVGNWGPYPPFYTADRLKFVYPVDLGNFASQWLTQPKSQSQSYRSARLDLKGETDLAEVGRKYGETMKTLYEEFFFKSVTGEIDPAQEWDGYVEQFMSNGGARNIAELEKSPLVAALRLGKLEY